MSRRAFEYARLFEAVERAVAVAWRMTSFVGRRFPLAAFPMRLRLKTHGPVVNSGSILQDSA
jgi:hypothetical protein